MYKPPYSFYKNIKFPESEIQHVIKKLNGMSNLDTRRDECTTSFFLEEQERPEKIWRHRYSQIQEQLLRQIGIYTTCRYEFYYWSQLYNKGDSHCPHHHFGDGSIISWVHFVRSSFKAFRFTDKDLNYFIPPEQEEGDIICFPSYLCHQAMPSCTDEQRFIVAGNIKITQLDL